MSIISVNIIASSAPKNSTKSEERRESESAMLHIEQNKFREVIFYFFLKHELAIKCGPGLKPHPFLVKPVIVDCYTTSKDHYLRQVLKTLVKKQ